MSSQKTNFQTKINVLIFGIENNPNFLLAPFLEKLCMEGVLAMNEDGRFIVSYALCENKGHNNHENLDAREVPEVPEVPEGSDTSSRITCAEIDSIMECIVYSLYHNKHDLYLFFAMVDYPDPNSLYDHLAYFKGRITDKKPFVLDVTRKGHVEAVNHLWNNSDPKYNDLIVRSIQESFILKDLAYFQPNSSKIRPRDKEKVESITKGFVASLAHRI